MVVKQQSINQHTGTTVPSIMVNTTCNERTTQSFSHSGKSFDPNFYPLGERSKHLG